jgi:Interferon-induced transmembrane protein
VPPPPNHLGLAVLGIVLFFPLGVAALMKSLEVPRLWKAGKHTEAIVAAGAAKARAVWAVIVFVVVLAAVAAVRFVPQFS